MPTRLFDRATGLIQSGTGVTKGVGVVADSTVTSVETGNDVVHRSVITLTDLPVTVGNTTGVSFGGTKVIDMLEGRVLILGATVGAITFDLTDSGNVTPIDDADGGDIAFGTTAPSDGTLSGTDVNIIPSHSIDPISGGSAGAALGASVQLDGTTTPVDIYVNVLIDDADVGDGASDVILVSGVLTLVWVNLGDY